MEKVLLSPQLSPSELAHVERLRRTTRWRFELPCWYADSDAASTRTWKRLKPGDLCRTTTHLFVAHCDLVPVQRLVGVHDPANGTYTAGTVCTYLGKKVAYEMRWVGEFDEISDDESTHELLTPLRHAFLFPDGTVRFISRANYVVKLT